MKIEMLISTMFRTDMKFLDNMKVSSSYTVVNQTDFERYPNLQCSNEDGRIISNEDRGLSKSRNLALLSSSGDVCVIADDDIEYVSEYETVICKAYESLPDADIIIFNYSTNDKDRRPSNLGSKARLLNFFDLLKVNSVRITFKRDSVVSNDIKFNNLFGAGSIFTSGEENLFLKDCRDKGLKIYFYPANLCFVYFDSSSWFKGFNEEYFESKGAFSKEFFGAFSVLFLLQFLIRKYRKYNKTISIVQATTAFLRGQNKYKIIRNK
ncbi:glycosyltransferase family A protein [Chryseobacterium sp. A301]